MRGVEEVARGSVWVESTPRSCDSVSSFEYDFSKALVVFTTCDTWAGMPIAGFSSGSVGE